MLSSTLFYTVTLGIGIYYTHNTHNTQHQKTPINTTEYLGVEIHFQNPLRHPTHPTDNLIR